ncbi:MAG TPA: transposase [Vicinamibacterales bacterium]|jgi:putative transposase
MERKRPPRLTSFDYTGFYRYFLTICTFGRFPVFVDDTAVALVMVELTRTADDVPFSVIAYCFMPDHLHVLVEGTHPAADFREFVRIFKQRSAFQWRQQHGTVLWQRSYFEHVLREDEAMVGVARYLLENPVRAGIVERPEDYPYLGSMTVALRDLLYSVQI